MPCTSEIMIGLRAEKPCGAFRPADTSRGWLKHRPVRYGFAVLAVALAAVLRYLLAEFLGADLAYITFYPVTLLVAVIGGFGPGLLATLLSAACVDYIFLAPAWQFGFKSYPGTLELALFSIMGLCISTLAGAAHRMRGRYGRARETTAEETLRDSEARYRSLAELSPDAIFINCDDRICYVNPVFMKLLGAESANQLLGKSPFEFIHPDDHAMVRERIQQILEGEIAPLAEERYLRLDGTTVQVEVAVAPYHDLSGPGIQVVLRDISVRKEAEDALVQQAVELREQAGQLRDADRLKDEFLAMLAHELRNPLTPILITAQLLERRGAEDPALLQWASSTIRHQCEHLTRLVNELLDVSRVTRGNITLHKTSIDLRKLIARAVEISKPLVDEHKHTLNLIQSPEPMFMEADAVRLEQVMGNLLDNAIKYTPEGGQIWLSLSREAEAAVIRVRDSGIGIPPAMLPRVFELFSQAERTLDRTQGGLGIGLALAKRLIELHGGSVEALSEGIGHGSEFVVRLPLLSHAPHADASLAPEALRQVQKPILRGLVVDDNENVLKSMAILLKTMGHDVREAHSGKEALDIAKTASLDFVLLDIGMPGISGYEVARQLRQTPTCRHLKLIAMTGYGQEYDRQQSKKAGFDHHMVKPVDPEELENILEAMG